MFLRGAGGQARLLRGPGGGHMLHAISRQEDFRRKLLAEEAIEKLRTRLLDLSPRNRLVSYKFPAARSLSFADNPILETVFERLVNEGKPFVLSYLPERHRDGKRLDPRTAAELQGIDPDVEPKPCRGQQPARLQTLMFPEELERQLRKMANEARTVIEETGANVLFLIFGFLEFTEGRTDGKTLVAPLIAVPVTLRKSGAVDPMARTYEYVVEFNGEDVTANSTLAEKLRADHALQLPEWDNDDGPESYFRKVDPLARGRQGWRVRRQLTLGMLSFGKLAIWADLDVRRNSSLLKNGLLLDILTGNAERPDGPSFAEDYEIDRRREGELPLIYDADSSQHSAIIDALAGHNLVVNGPPGTGKSQTITNLIAALLASGKTVLFVSEKMAALEVVHHRLKLAGLGHFCLKLHSHRSQKRGLLDDVHARMRQDFECPAGYKEKQEALALRKRRLNGVASMLNEKADIALDMTVHELLWRAARLRADVAGIADSLQGVRIDGQPAWDLAAIESKRAALLECAHALAACGYGDARAPWCGFEPAGLLPPWDREVVRVLEIALSAAREGAAAAQALRDGGFGSDSTVRTVEALYHASRSLPPWPEAGDPELLGRLCARSAAEAQRLVDRVVRVVLSARERWQESKIVLPDENAPELSPARDAFAECRNVLGSGWLSWSTDKFASVFEPLRRLAPELPGIAAAAGVPFVTVRQQYAKASTAVTALSSLPDSCLSDMLAAASGLHVLSSDLLRLLEFIESLVDTRHLKWDGTAAALPTLCALTEDGFRKDAEPVDAATIDTASRLARCVDPLLTSDQLGERARELRECDVKARAALARCHELAKSLGIPCDNSDEVLRELDVLTAVAEMAPQNRLDGRRPIFGKDSADRLITRIERGGESERTRRTHLQAEIRLRDLPEPQELRRASAALRRRHRLFALFDKEWRDARRLFAALEVERRSRSDADRAELLAQAADWLEDSRALDDSAQLREIFGDLFSGTSTDVNALRELRKWYRDAEARLASVPRLAQSFDPTTTPKAVLMLLSRRRQETSADVEFLERLATALQRGGVAESCGATTWTERLQTIDNAARAADEARAFYSRYVNTDVTLSRALCLLDAKRIVAEHAEEIAGLGCAAEGLRAAAGQFAGAWLNRRPAALRPLLASTWSTVENVKSAAEVLVNAGAGASTPRQVARMLSAVAAIEMALNAAGVSGDAVADWAGYASWVGKVAHVTGTLQQSIGPHAGADATLNAIERACELRVAAQAELTSLHADAEVQAAFGPLLRGMDTRLDSIAATLKWELDVHRLAIEPTAKRALLSAQVRARMVALTRHTETAVAALDRTKTAMERLKGFGEFDWARFHRRTEETVTSLEWPAISARIEEALAAADILVAWSRYVGARERCKTSGLGALVQLLEARRIGPENASAALEFVIFHGLSASVLSRKPELRDFNGLAHDGLRAEFRKIDSELTKLAGKYAAWQIAKRTKVPRGESGPYAGDRTEKCLLDHEIGKSTRHIPIRQLVRRAGGALQALKPCFMMGPLSVAEYLEQEALRFDVVIMDEASQLRPEDALGAVARGSQLIVVGDKKQLPPTSFFDRMLDGGSEEGEEEIPAVADGQESILEVCEGLFRPIRSLNWHYRSKHESLIAFSNHRFYDNRLIVFPARYERHADYGVRFRYVRDGVYENRQNRREAEVVVAAALEHMAKRNSESLGIVAVNLTQRDLIEELLERQMKARPDVAKFLEHWEREGWPLFVKNLENVQGDERDVIYVSTTYGRPQGSNKVRQNFGPIAGVNGGRRLNVLFTRARCRIELFTSMTEDDVVLEERTPEGTKALRAYLEYARRKVMPDSEWTGRRPESDFEVAVGSMLKERGYDVVPQFGVARYRIDVAVRNPDRPGAFLAAVECDGASYHSAKSARDRDRIRDEMLERLGWRDHIYRIWSTDWFSSPERESRKLLGFLEARRNQAAADTWREYEDDSDVCSGSEPLSTPHDVAESRGAETGQADVGDDRFVEVGDTITYVFTDTPEKKKVAQITENVELAGNGVVYAGLPIAKVLLDLGVGDEGELRIAGEPSRRVRVLKIERA